MDNSNDRLDRIEALQQRTQQQIDSNARAIQALADRISELAQVQADAQEEREELRRATLGIANLLSSLDSHRPTILRKLNISPAI